MRGFTAAVVVFWSLLLSSIAWELYRIDQSLTHLSAPMRNLATVSTTNVSAHPGETREQRIERRARDQREAIDEATAVFKRSLELSLEDKAATARPSR